MPHNNKAQIEKNDVYQAILYVFITKISIFLAIIFGIIMVWHGMIIYTKAIEYQRLRDLPKTEEMLEVYYDKQKLIEIDKNTFKLGIYNISIGTKIYYYQGWKSVINGQEKYFTKSINKNPNKLDPKNLL